MSACKVHVWPGVFARGSRRRCCRCGAVQTLSDHALAYRNRLESARASIVDGWLSALVPLLECGWRFR